MDSMNGTDWTGFPGRDGPTPPSVDAKGRKVVSLMSDRELLEECVTWQRTTGDTLEAFMDSMTKNPMMKMLAGRFTK